ncbi:hypothetical protein ACFFWC_28205 [Plantactinospora siamensis]|uniref:Uncharacterized protein n=1 Tax=Plantactinospora siamensis TaxID=555372 RepID=A0ABV6NQA5_9ACTN
MTFDYYLLMRRGDQEGSPVNVMAVALGDRPVEAVIWGYRNNRWEFRPEVAIAHLYEDRELPIRLTDRETAEQAALTFTEVPLPTEAELTEICRTAPRRGSRRS